MNYKILGQKELGTLNYPKNTKDILGQVQKQIPTGKDLKSISMTSSKNIQSSDGKDDKLRLLEYSNVQDTIFDPEENFKNGLLNSEIGSNFVYWKRKDDIAVCACSNTDPVFIAKNYNNGNMAIGTILKSCLKQYLPSTLKALSEKLEGKYFMILALSPRNIYIDQDSGMAVTIPLHVCSQARPFAKDVEFGQDPNNSKNNLFGYKSGRKNIVVAW